MKKQLFLIIVFALLGCDSGDLIKGRCFYMGYTLDQQTASSSASLFNDSDIVNYHFDDGVPWTDLIRDSSIPTHILSNWSLLKEITPSDHKVYLSVSPLAITHDKPAIDNSLQRKSVNGIDSMSFENEQLKNAYVTYCKKIIDYFEPDFFNMSADANLFYSMKPDSWPAFIKFHDQIYHELKSSYPELIIFTSVSIEPALDGFDPGSDYLIQRLAILQILDNSDLFALSVHPQSLASVSGLKNKNAFSELFNLSKKPFALSIAENGPYLHSIKQQNKISGTQDFNACLEMTLSACLNREAVFVVSSKSNSNYISSEITAAVWKKYLSVDFN